MAANPSTESGESSTLVQVEQAIANYAKAYDALEQLQNPRGPIPQGDQKTGAVGEFYAHLYLLGKYPNADVIFGGNGNPVWDIKVTDNESVWHVQVKTVSAFSKTGRLSPIHVGWQELYIIRLNKQLQPDGFWQVKSDMALPKYINAPLSNQSSSIAKAGLFSHNEIDDFSKNVAAGKLRCIVAITG
ncbi:hypothetical protein [Hymenobacter nivis]|uniref:hypothetical protein n=1 Tax=Hymenobacter nivis TaxID=1850093 RepID=UPI0013A56779|nr:hypothetical protein [Hymenobacter nivis]